MKNPLLAFEDWFLAQEPDVMTHTASFLFLGLPDSKIGNRQFIENDVSDLLKIWLHEKALEEKCRVLGTAVAVRSVIDFFLMNTRISNARSDVLKSVTDWTLETSELLSGTAWNKARESWIFLCANELSDAGLDLWGIEEK
jgi:hypothetical protein